MKAIGLKFSSNVLLLVAKNALLTNSHPTFGSNTCPHNDNKPLIDRITPRWIQQFQEVHKIVHQTQTRKLMVIEPAKNRVYWAVYGILYGDIVVNFISAKCFKRICTRILMKHISSSTWMTVAHWGSVETSWWSTLTWYPEKLEWQWWSRSLKGFMEIFSHRLWSSKMHPTRIWSITYPTTCLEYVIAQQRRFSWWVMCWLSITKMDKFHLLI